ncbi:MAG: O-antigen ligase family protein [Nitrosospira sp.]|nr:O-antigen ligase family protein [Nitrosospira sp.]
MPRGKKADAGRDAPAPPPRRVVRTGKDASALHIRYDTAVYERPCSVKVSTSAGSPAQVQSAAAWRGVLPKFALLFFGIALWHKGLSFYAYYLLPLAWVLDGGLGRFRDTAREPLVIAMLVLCGALGLGILWSDDPGHGFKVWRRYLAFLVFIPYFALLNKERLPWATGGMLIGYFGALALGIYQWTVVGAQGIPPLAMPYLHFSSMLGIGIILALYLAANANRKIRAALWLLAILLLFLQFNQNARGILIATVLSSALLILLLYRQEIRTFFAILSSLIVLVAIFAYNSPAFQERLEQARNDIELSKAGEYGSSVGYRLALWDIGLHGIAERPFSGHGTGMAVNYFNKTVETYKHGAYKDVRQFHDDILHYHNDWIEIAMHIGMLGLAAYAYLLWSWYKTLKLRQLTDLGAALICFIVLSGLTDNLVFFRQTIYLLLVVTAISIAWRKYHGVVYGQPRIDRSRN